MDFQQILQLAQQGESFLLANDGQYLGKLSLNRYDSNSVSNPYGSYGSQYSFTSIFNVYGTYGSPYSSLSPRNRYTNTPPAIYLRGQHIGYLTKNPYLGFNNVDPDTLFNWMESNCLNY
jgi:hypothetical protein